MRISAVLTAIACLLGLAPGAHASQVLASPAVYASPNQHSAQCNLGNFGARDVPITAFDIVDEAGNAFPVNRGGGISVPAGFVCQISALNIPSGSAVACSATVSNGNTVRGSLTLFDGHGVPLRSSELR